MAKGTASLSISGPVVIGETGDPTAVQHADWAHAAVNGLRSAIEDIEQSLAPILRGSDPHGEGIASPSQAFSPHSSQLESLTADIQSLESWVRNLIGRIDL